MDWGRFIAGIGIAVVAAAWAVGLWLERGGFGFLIRQPRLPGSDGPVSSRSAPASRGSR